MSIELSRGAEFHFSLATATNATGALSSPVIDLKNFESVIALATIDSTGSNGANSGLTCSVGSASGSLSQTTGQVSITKVGLYMDIYRPVQRYIRFDFTATASGDVKALVVIPYGAKSLPTTQPASTTGGRYYTPGTGTATG